MQQYSVLMSVYCKEEPAHFRESMRSMLEQTVQPTDFTVVCDGPLGVQLDSVLEEMLAAYPEIVHPVRLEKNMGIGYATNIGLKMCKCELVAKMDADDISTPDRCERQLACFAADPELAICGGYIAEFEENPQYPIAVRTVPLTQKEIWEKGRRRMPFNNPSIMYRRSAVLAVGGYSDMHRNEDYDLVSRLLSCGYRGRNIPEVLVYMRSDLDAYRRRGSVATLKGCISSRWRSYRRGYARLWDFCYCLFGQLFLVLCPSRLRRWVYKKFLRKEVT